MKRKSGLIISRRPGEAFVANGPAAIMVESIDGNRVRLRIQAPDSTTVLREELIVENHDNDSSGRDDNLPSEGGDGAARKPWELGNPPSEPHRTDKSYLANSLPRDTQAG